jgi:hypothetical protein
VDLTGAIKWTDITDFIMKFPLTTKLSGVSHGECQDNIKQFGCPDTGYYILIREPDNPHDTNAISVSLGGVTWGLYIVNMTDRKYYLNGRFQGSGIAEELLKRATGQVNFTAADGHINYDVLMLEAIEDCGLPNDGSKFIADSSWFKGQMTEVELPLFVIGY